MNELSEITAVILSGVEERLSSKTIFNLWFNNFELISLSSDKAVFNTANSLRKEIIESKYIEMLRDAVENAIGFPVEIEITCPPKESNTIEIDKTYEVIDKEVYHKESEEKKEEIAKFLSEDSEIQNKSLLLDYTFDNFIEGDSNKFVKAACLAVTKELTYYNPLFIHGQSGLGKTHLLYAIINEIKKNNPKINIVYKKCEDFMNEMIDAISKTESVSFREKYRKADVLLIDDIQFLSGKVATQEEFFHTFSTLYENDKQIILTSDRPPKDIKPLEDRLRTRFESGLMAEVSPPGFELRTAIIKHKANAMNLLISNEQIDYMADRIHRKIRQIEGVLKRLYALNYLSSVPVTKESIDEAISFIDPGNIPTDALVEKILGVVSKNLSVSVEDLKSRRKTENISYARHTSIFLIKQLTDLTLKEIGNIFGRDHSTVLSSINKIEDDIKTKNRVKNEINKLIKEIKGT